MVLCGTASFKDVDKEEPMSGGGKQAQRKEKKKPGAGKKENPYASRGLDKFSMVLAELESRREKVLRRVDGGDHVMVRFVQSETKGWVPIVVKLPAEEPAAKAEPKKKCKMFAICCTSIWWYLVPILNGEDGGPRSMGKTGRHLGKKASDKKIGEKINWASLPPSHGKKGSSGDHEVISPRRSHGKKSSSGDHEVISPRRSHGKKSSSSGDHDVISPRSHAHGKKG
uniref:Uncharacterized protein n=1 Tax=Aegilops tauschii TaxID=37682 RepID=M8AYW0_AEGTA